MVLVRGNQTTGGTMIHELFFMYFVAASISFTVICTFCMLDTWITGREYPGGASFGALIMAAMIGAIITVGTVAGAYILTNDLESSVFMAMTVWFTQGP